MIDNAPLSKTRARIERLLEQLDDSFLEREPHVRLALLSLIAGHHMLMLGPPGTAKSLLARAICQCVEGGRYFEYLLSRFTHPDELFGPVSIPGLKEEDYRRQTKGYLPDAHVAFLDEIFKANSAILNSLLTLINERVFHHGTHRDAVPLLALIGASNEPPESDALAALYDRFLVRTAVHPLARQENFLRVCLGEITAFEPAKSERLTLEEVAEIRSQSTSVRADEDIRQVLTRLREALHSEEIPASDRRWRWALELVRVSAATSGREEIAFVDLLLLQHCFGTPFETDAQVQRIVSQALLASAHPVFDLQSLQDMASELRRLPAPHERFLAAKTRRLTLIDTLNERCARLEARMDRRRNELMQSARQSVWVDELPTELFAAMLAARSKLREFVGPLRAMIEEYRPRLKGFSLIGRFFGAFVLQSQLHSMFLQSTDTRPPLLWVSGPGEPPQRWTGLMSGGQLVMDPMRLTRAQEGIEHTPWHEAVLHFELNDDRLFEACRQDDWRREAQRWFDEVWHEARGRDALPNEAAANDAFLAMLEHYHSAASFESFPMPEDPNDAPRRPDHP